MSNQNTYNVQVRMPVGNGSVVRNVPVQASNPYEARQLANATYGSTQVGGVLRKS